jgi:hypothetical protein
MDTFAIFGLLFFALVVIALLSNAFHAAMRIRLLRMDTARDRIEWLSFRSWNEVMDNYEALFPRSVLPRFCRFAFWAFIFFFAITLFAIILKSR